MATGTPIPKTSPDNGSDREASLPNEPAAPAAPLRAEGQARGSHKPRTKKSIFERLTSFGGQDARDERAYHCARALTALVPHLQNSERQAALRDARAIAASISDDDSRNRAQVLSALIPLLPEAERENTLRDAVDAAYKCEESGRVVALSALIPLLPEAERENALRDAVDAANECEDRLRGYALSDLVQFLPDDAIQRLFTEAIEFTCYTHKFVLSKLAPYLPKKLLRDAFLAAKTYKSFTLLSAIIPNLPVSERDSVVRDAFAEATKVSDDHQRVHAIGALAPHLSETLLCDALATARKSPQEEYQVNVIAALAPHLSEPLLQEALSLAKTMSDQNCRTESLIKLVPFLHDADRETTIRECLEHPIDYAFLRSRIAAHISPISKAERDAILRDTMAMGAETGIAIITPPCPRISVHAFCESQEFSRVIEAAAADTLMSKAYVKIHMGGILAAVEAFRSAPTPNLIVLETLSARSQLIKQLESLAKFCDPGTKVIVIGQENNLSLYRDLISRGVSNYLVAPLSARDFVAHVSMLYGTHSAEYEVALRTALDEASEIINGFCDRAICKIAPYLQVNEALAAIKKIPSVSFQADALIKLAPRLPQSLLGEALNIARGLCVEQKQQDSTNPPAYESNNEIDFHTNVVDNQRQMPDYDNIIDAILERELDRLELSFGIEAARKAFARRASAGESALDPGMGSRDQKSRVLAVEGAPLAASNAAVDTATHDSEPTTLPAPNSTLGVKWLRVSELTDDQKARRRAYEAKKKKRYRARKAAEAAPSP